MNRDIDLSAKIARIKDMKPMVPGGFNCIDFQLGDSGYGVRIILTFEAGQWLVSTSIGLLNTEGEGNYEPMELDRWTEPLRKSATAAADEVLELFDVDPATKSAVQGHTVVLFKFRERQ
jgi:hypothetical protein